MLEVLSFCDRERALLPSINITVLTFLVKKENEAFRGVYFLRVRKKTLSQISFLKSFSSSNLKVSTYKPWKQVLNQLHDSTFIPFL